MGKKPNNDSGEHPSFGPKVENFTVHADERMRQRGVSVQGIKNALEKPFLVGDLKVDDYGRKSQKFIGKEATVIINPETGIVVTTWKTGKATIKKYGGINNV